VIDLPLLEPMVSVLGPDAAIYKTSGEKPPRTGSRSLTTSPRNVYGTSDGRFIAISASIQAMAERLFRAIGRRTMNHRSKFRTKPDRVRNIDECDGIVAIGRGRTLEENMAVFEARKSPRRCLRNRPVAGRSHVQERGVLVEAPDAEAGSVLNAQCSFRVCRTRRASLRRARQTWVSIRVRFWSPSAGTRRGSTRLWPMA